MAPHDPPDSSDGGAPDTPEFDLHTRHADLHPYAIGNVESTDIYCLALLHFKNTIAPESALFTTWPPTDDDQQWYCLAILRELLPDGDYRSLVSALNDTPRLAREAGIDPQDPPHYSTISRHVNALAVDDAVVEEAASRADRAARYTVMYDRPLDTLGPDPPEPDPEHRQWTAEDPVEMPEKMTQATRVVAEYLALTLPALGFGREKTAPNYEYPTESFYRLLAHIALEDCYAANGADVLAWLTDDDVKVPEPATLRQYAREYEVEAIEEKFMKGTCRLLEREELLPEEPVHLAYDITDVPWYGREHEWTSGGRQSANTTSYWKHAVLSVASRDRNYVLGATPIKSETETADALRRLIRRVSKHANFELGHVYCDRGMYQGDVVTTCREQGLEFLIQAKDQGAPGELMARLGDEEADGENGVRFAGLPKAKRVNTFAYPIHPGEIGSDERDESHTAWITD